jgi:pilus assembly protein CpaE
MVLMQYKILVVEDDPTFMKLIKALLIQEGYVVGEAEHGALALEMVETFKPDCIISDVMMPGVDGFQLCQLLRTHPETSHMPIIMLTALNALEQKLKGFEVGADDYLEKPFESAELLARVTAAIRRGEQRYVETDSPSRKGKVIAVFSLRGGAGTSTIAVNIASAQSQFWEQEVVLVDMDLVAGQSALFMNAPLQTTWANLAELSPMNVDDELIEKVLIRHDSGVKILAAPQQPEQGELIAPEVVAKVIQILKGRYDYVILDMPHHFDENNLAAMDRAESILLVATQEIAGIRSAMTALRVFEGLQYDPKKISLVVNTNNAVASITTDMIEKTLRHQVEFYIPYSPQVVIPSIDTGTPVVLEKPESRFGIALENLAFIVSKPEHNQEIVENPNAALSRIYKRMKKKK